MESPESELMCVNLEQEQDMNRSDNDIVEYSGLLIKKLEREKMKNTKWRSGQDAEKKLPGQSLNKENLGKQK